MSERPKDICRGPVDYTGICAWCGSQYLLEDEDRFLHSASGNCRAVRTDRPRREVAPTFAPTLVELIKIDCWNCDSSITLNSMYHHEWHAALMRGETLVSICEKCGVGIDVRKSQLVGAPTITREGVDALKKALKKGV